MFFIFLFLLNFALFSPSLGAYFFLDDADWLVHARNIATNHSLLFQPEGGRLRPFLLLSYHAQLKLFGLNAPYYHLCNIIVHFLNACLIYFLAKKLSPRLRLSPLSDKLFPVFSSILFSILFAHYQPVVWANFISESLCAFFVLLSFIIFLKIFDSRVITNRLLLFLVSLIFYALALCTKESAYGFPFVILASSFFIIQKEKVSPLLIIPYFLLPALHFIFTGNFGYLSLVQEQNLSSSAPTLGLHFIPITLDCLTDLMLSLTGIVRIPGFAGLAQGQFGSLYNAFVYVNHALAGIFFILLVLFFVRLRNIIQSGKFYFLKQTVMQSLKQKKNIFSAETSFIFFCILSTFFLFLPNSFFFYLFTQTGASLARYRYLYLPSAAFCLLASYAFSKAISAENKIKSSAAVLLFLSVCAANMTNIFVMEKYHITQGQKVKKYMHTLQSLKPPLKDGDMVLMLDFPQEEAILQSFHMKAYAELFLRKKINLEWKTFDEFSRTPQEKKNMHVIFFNKARARILQ